MKKATQFLLRSSIAAAALALASSAASAKANLTENTAKSVYEAEFTLEGQNFGSGDFITPGLISVNYANKNFFVFCIDPTVQLNTLSNNYSVSAFKASTSVTRLYEQFYASTVSGASSAYATGAAAFQLALWELNNDLDKTGTASLLSGKMAFADLSDDAVAEANQMMLTATNSSIALKHTYKFTELSSNGSQALLRVTAVPEAQTWAMLLAGLGMIGFMRRRNKAA